MYKIIGIIGLVLICVGMVVKSRKVRDVICIFGGAGLLIYSIYLGDTIFTILQAVYIIVIIFDIIKRRNN